MDVTYTFLVILGLVGLLNGQESTTEPPSTTELPSTTEPPSTTESVNVTEVTTEVPETTTETEEPSFGSPGLYGGSYYDPNVTNPSNIHYVHGTYQGPRAAYYTRQHYFRDKGTDGTFDYYLGFGISKMTDSDFRYRDFHYFYHDLNRTIGKNESLRSDFIIACHPNATLCPENTETVCLRNGTIYCMSKITVVVPCEHNETMSCVNSVVPCVLNCIRVSGSFEPVSLPCLGNVVIDDVYEDHRGNTLNHVGGTFVVVKALEEREKTFCLTVIVDPVPMAPEN